MVKPHLVAWTFSTPAQWLPPLLMAIGIVVLATVAVMLIRDRRAETLRQAAAASQDAATHEELLQAATRMAALLESAQSLAHRLEGQIACAESLVAHAETPDRAHSEPRSVHGTHGSSNAARAGEEPRSPLPDADSHEARHSMVCAMADAGATPLAIARELNEHVGTIELILALRSAQHVSGERRSPFSRP